MTKTSLDTASAAPASCLIALPRRGLIAVSGPDAAGFLNAVLTAQIATLPVGKATLAALLTPQGKIIADMLVANASDEEPLYFLDINRGFAQPVAEKLETYRLRAKAGIAVLDAGVGVYVALDSAPVSSDSFYAFPDPRGEVLGQRLYGPGAAIEGALATLPAGEESQLTARRIALGVPECGPDYLPLASFPHEANLDQLGGVDFKKGCYVGQEIVSRMEYRGTARTRTLIARFLNGFGVESGAPVQAGEMLIGALGESCADAALAQVRLDKLEEARSKNVALTGGGVAMTLEKPAYARF